MTHDPNKIMFRIVRRSFFIVRQKVFAGILNPATGAAA